MTAESTHLVAGLLLGAGLTLLALMVGSVMRTWRLNASTRARGPVPQTRDSPPRPRRSRP